MYKCLSILLLIVPVVFSGKVLFFMPVIPKSSKIAWYPLAKAMAENGHQVTIVSPYPSQKEVQNLEEIIIDNEKLMVYQDEVSKAILGKNLSHWEISRQLTQFIKPALELNNQTFDTLKAMNFFNERAYDAVVLISVGGNEPGLFVAHHFKATIVTFFVQQMSLLSQDWSVGQPHHPAYVPQISTLFQ